MPEVSQLFIHPVKSCRLQAVEKVLLDKYGFQGDRRWLIVDEHGTPITQRDTPALANITATILESMTIKLSAQELEPLTADLDSSQAIRAETEIWGTACAGIDCGDQAGEWLERFLGKPARLLAMDAMFDRPIKTRPSDQVSFADSYPVLITSISSLDALNEKLDTPVPMARFRPNIVISGCEAFEEDTWKRIRIGESIFTAAGHSTRCSMITVDPSTGLRSGKEPLATLTKLRKAISAKPIFGQNYVNESKTGSIEVGMTVHILE